MQLNLKTSIFFLASLFYLSFNGSAKKNEPIYVYEIELNKTANSYDEAMLVSCIQGIINRERPDIYLVYPGEERLSVFNHVKEKVAAKPKYWLKKMQEEGRWLSNRKGVKIPNLDSLYFFTKPKIKGAVIWDPEVPASMNVANTIAGVEDALVLSPELAETLIKKWDLKIIKDLRGMFTGAETGSKKNDAYRWAIREYLAKGLCSSHFLCLYEDPFYTREKGDVGYVVTRDWAIKNRSFVYDLSPWGDELPSDDTSQTLGTDLETYKMMLDEVLKQSNGKHMTEVVGFFSFDKYSNYGQNKSAHDPVPTEWETVHLISPYNCYQNTVASNCYNQSFHSHAKFKKLQQQKPEIKKLKNKTYISVLMADFDSGTPLYDFMPRLWDNKKRGEIPLMWGINPNLIKTYPDIISYYYETKTSNDFFAADASAAGYMNPNRIQDEYIPLFIQHNKHFYNQLDMSISPMVLDQKEPTHKVKDAFLEFSPDGFATIVIDFHEWKHGGPKDQIWKGMPVTNLINTVDMIREPENAAANISKVIPKNNKTPSFHLYRIIWTTPEDVIQTIEILKKKRHDLEIEVVDPYNFFNLFKQHLESKQQ